MEESLLALVLLAQLSGFIKFGGSIGFFRFLRLKKRSLKPNNAFYEAK
jgi:hypothetical protein